MNRRVVVTGMGVVTPLGCEVDELMQNLLAAKSGIRDLVYLDTNEFKVKFGGEVHDFSPEPYVVKKEAKRVDRFSAFAMYSAGRAVDQSGIDFSKENPDRCGAIIGSGIGGLWEIETQMQRLIAKGPDRVSPFVIPKLMLNAAGGNVSITYGLRGPNFGVATACASAANAMGCALRSIQTGETDVMVTGGSEAAVTPMALAGFQNMKALSTRNDDPQRASRPFDKDRDGFVLAEGAGILVFEEYEHAKARGANILAEILGFGTTADAGHITSPDAQGAGAGRAMAEALTDAKLNPADIGYINAHGTSTPLGDKAETQAVKTVFGSDAKSVSISSTKSALGHSLGASGGIELVICISAINNGSIPPTINLDTPDPDCDLDYTPREARQKDVKIAMSNSFGFGGHNASVICGKV
ncbi:beta-ketoacyl-ACP synthase II [Rosistilla oblonga]|uniref:3-oxoacyl-[acyl-carrier-protein] synthase 2 n=1 Tax=Rosistilla oblonga TaxID=2527990 RepID=A0A518IMS3_9BACT|nr:beta-ketoacyl-ACP synthase II [Rosistilla oblonga]QDV54384.1 3-oxoacyl-[acyl-carrier-protein] synthase 2 [Rosistilla oblonga]